MLLKKHVKVHEHQAIGVAITVIILKALYPYSRFSRCCWTFNCFLYILGAYWLSEWCFISSHFTVLQWSSYRFVDITFSQIIVKEPHRSSFNQKNKNTGQTIWLKMTKYTVSQSEPTVFPPPPKSQFLAHMNMPFSYCQHDKSLNCTSLLAGPTKNAVFNVRWDITF